MKKFAMYKAERQLDEALFGMFGNKAPENDSSLDHKKLWDQINGFVIAHLVSGGQPGEALELIKTKYAQHWNKVIGAFTKRGIDPNILEEKIMQDAEDQFQLRQRVLNDLGNYLHRGYDIEYIKNELPEVQRAIAVGLVGREELEKAAAVAHNKYRKAVASRKGWETRRNKQLDAQQGSMDDLRKGGDILRGPWQYGN
jgi:hypothetical protein